MVLILDDCVGFNCCFLLNHVLFSVSRVRTKYLYRENLGRDIELIFCILFSNSPEFHLEGNNIGVCR